MYRHVGLVPEREAVYAVPDRARVRAAQRPAPGRRRPGRRGGPGDRDGRPDRCRGPADRHVLEGHAPAGQDRRRARPRPADPAPRRAVQRDGPAPAAAHDGAAPDDGRRGPDDPVLVAHPRGGRAARRTRCWSSTPGGWRRRATSASIRRLMTDRPHTFTVRSSDDRRLAAALMADRSVFGAELVSTAASRPDRRLRRLHRGRCPGSPATRRSPCSRSARPTSRSRASSATWCADERHGAARRASPCAACSAGAGRSCSRCWPALPVLIALLVRLSGGRPDADRDPRQARRSDGHAARRAGLRDRGDRFGDRRRDRGLPAGQADRALARWRRRRSSSRPA